MQHVLHSLLRATMTVSVHDPIRLRVAVNLVPRSSFRSTGTVLPVLESQLISTLTSERSHHSIALHTTIVSAHALAVMEREFREWITCNPQRERERERERERSQSTDEPISLSV